MAYQGVFGADDLWRFGLNEEFQRNAFTSNGAASAMKAGLMLSDTLSTVSPTYSRRSAAGERIRP